MMDAQVLQFWEAEARKLHWEEPWGEALEWSPPFAKWFLGGRLNAAYNCLDRHVEAGLGDRVAIYWEGEPGDRRVLTYRDLWRDVMRAANGLVDLGVGKGDRVAIYMPMIPEAVVAMLACARLGVVHTVVFGGFSPDALRTRVVDVGAKLVITADGGWRRGTMLGLKSVVDEAINDVPMVEQVLVVQRTGQKVAWTQGRDRWWHEVMEQQGDEHVALAHDAETPLFVLYTSGTTAKPKGILHSTGGYLTQVASSMRLVFGVQPETDVYWCTADIGWITGHSYGVYGPLANGMTQVMYEGAPDMPDRGRWWEIIQRYGVTIFYTSPTAVRMFMKWGTKEIERYDLSSLRVLGSVGEPINPEAWRWYRGVIGSGTAPIADTWWQTETGAICLAPDLSSDDVKPGAVRGALSGISAMVVDEVGRPVGRGESGYLTLTRPWPAMLRGIWGDEVRYRETYWSRFTGLYFTGDRARRDEDGDIWVLGRVDDVINVSGHRISTAEVESALVGHEHVAEAAVVGVYDEIKGQALVAFVVLEESTVEHVDSDLEAELCIWVARKIGSFAKPARVWRVTELPKTRSGKIMRRLLQDVLEGRGLGDVTSLADGSVMETIAATVEKTKRG